MILNNLSLLFYSYILKSIIILNYITNILLILPYFLLYSIYHHLLFYNYLQVSICPCNTLLVLIINLLF